MFERFQYVIIIGRFFKMINVGSIAQQHRSLNPLIVIWKNSAIFSS